MVDSTVERRQLRRQALELVNDAFELDERERDEFVRRSTEGDARLEAQVRSFMARHAELGDFLEPPDPDAGLCKWLEEVAPGDVDATGPGDPDYEGVLLEERYSVGPSIGSGAYGVVHRARDTLTGQDVAVKIAIRAGRGRSLQLESEMSALLALDIPGVVPLLDFGLFGERRFLVMPLIEGAPFPGEHSPRNAAGAVAWDAMERTVVALFDVLSRLHVRAFVHGDIKPGNVLITADGRPIVLDLGAAVERPDDATLASPPLGVNGWVGTLAFCSPERLSNPSQLPTSADDLYSVGVMLFAALTGALPHMNDDTSDFVRARTQDSPSSVELIALGVPQSVRAFVLRMLAVDPAQRLPSAAHAIAELSRTRPPLDTLAGMSLPGRDDVLASLLAAARAQRSIDVTGRAGCGKSRVLRAARSALEAEGRTVRVTEAGGEPGDGLREAFGRRADAWSILELQRQFEQALRSGDVFIADDHHRLDEWSRERLERGRDRGVVIRGSRLPLPGALELLRIPVSALQGLFGGHDWLFHEPEDAAALLHEKTQGVPSSVLAELRAWLRAGLARLQGGRVFVAPRALERIPWLGPTLALEVDHRNVARVAVDDPDASLLLRLCLLAGPHGSLDVLEAASGWSTAEIRGRMAGLVQNGSVLEVGPDAWAALAVDASAAAWTPLERRRLHGRLADALAPGTVGRAAHLLAAERLDDALVEAQHLLKASYGADRLGPAQAIAVRLLRVAGTPGLPAESVLDLIRVTVPIAVACGMAGWMRETLSAVQRVRLDDPLCAPLQRLLRAALITVNGDGRRGLALVESLEPFEQAELEFTRQSIRVRAARNRGAEASRRVVASATAWLEGSGLRSAGRAAAQWRGGLAYVEGDFAAAARLFEQASELAESRRARVSMLNNAASANLEDFRLDVASEQAARARTLAATLRDPHVEGSAVKVDLSAAYRAGDPRPVDPGLLRAAAEVRVPNLQAILVQNAAAIAWRAGDLKQATAWAQAALEIWQNYGQRWGVALIESFLRLLRSQADAVETTPPEMTSPPDVRDCPAPGIALQVLGLHAMAGARVSSSDSALAIELHARVPERHRPYRREVLSSDEALAAIEAAPRAS